MRIKTIDTGKRAHSHCSYLVNMLELCFYNTLEFFVFLTPYVPLLWKYFLDQGFQGALTLVVPDLRPRHFWWALLQSVVVHCLLFGRKGNDAVLLFPSRSTHVWSARRLQWDLWAYRCIF